MGVRGAVAPNPADDSEIDRAALGHTEDISIRYRAVVDLTDAYLDDPSQLTEHEWHELRRTLTRSELAHVVLHVTWYSRNKIRVALGLDSQAEPTPPGAPASHPASA